MSLKASSFPPIDKTQSSTNSNNSYTHTPATGTTFVSSPAGNNHLNSNNNNNRTSLNALRSLALLQDLQQYVQGVESEAAICRHQVSDSS